MAAKTPVFTAKTRAYIYKVVATTVPLLVALGVVTGDIAGYVLNIAAAVLSVSGSALALANVTPDSTDN